MTVIRQCTDGAARAFWWARALGIPGSSGRGHKTPNLIPFSADRIPRRKGWSAYAHRGDPELPRGVLRAWLFASARDPSLWAWAILPGQAGLVIVDVDDPALLADVIEMYGETPVKVKTPRGGWHLYYLAPADGSPVTSRSGVRGSHSYDVKSDGQTCHCPGQPHHVLRRSTYEAIVPGGWRGGEGKGDWAPGELRALLPEFRSAVYDADWRAHNPTPEEPEHLREHILAGTPAEREQGARYLAAAGPAIAGQDGHEHTRKLILKLGDLGFPERVAYDLLWKWNETCDPPWSQRELDSKVEHYYHHRNFPIGWRALDPSDDAPAENEPDDDEIREQLERALHDTAAAAGDDDDAPVQPPAEVTAPDAVADRGAAEEYAHAQRAAAAVRLDGGSRGAVAIAVATAAPGLTKDEAKSVVDAAFKTTALPHIDIDDLFADIPIAATQCRMVQESLRMSSADVPALFALGFASAALAARCRIEIAPRFKPPPHLFVVASVQSGRGKSATLDRMGGTITRRWQSDLAAEWDTVAARANVKRGVAKSLYQDYERQAVRLRRAIDDGAKKGELPGETSANLSHVTHLMERVACEVAATQLSRPVWIQADSTPEKFVDMVKEHGFALLMAGEGAAILQAFTQGATGRNRVAALLSAWTGEALDRARVGGGQNAVVRIDRYAELHACMVLPVQNFLLEPSGGVADRERSNTLRELAAAGFFARCLVAREEIVGVCEAPIEFDEDWIAAASAARAHVEAMTAAQRDWDGLLSDIWFSGCPAAPTQPLAPEYPDEPYAIAVSPEALTHLLRFQSWAAEQAKPGGRWTADRVAESAARVGEQAMRVAGVLACMRARSCNGVCIDIADARRAVRFTKDYAMPLVEHLLERAKPDPIADDADVVRAKIVDMQTRSPAGVSKRALHQRLGRGWGKVAGNDRMSRLDAAIEHLEIVEQLAVARNAKGAVVSVLFPLKPKVT